MSIGMPGFCNVLSSHGRGLGRSLSYVGRNHISLFMKLYGGGVHKVPFAAVSEASTWDHRAQDVFQSYFAVLAWNCYAKAACEAIS